MFVVARKLCLLQIEVLYFIKVGWLCSTGRSACWKYLQGFI